jgi:hypothetical protein
MILDYNRFKPIKTFGIILTVAGIFIALALFAESNAPKVDEGGIIFLSIMAIWHLASGLGILLRKMWGFKLMKVYLYIMYLGIPLGTLLARKILSYIKENEIELFFRGKEMRL